MYRKANWNYFK